jgi:hypothetical protein
MIEELAAKIKECDAKWEEVGREYADLVLAEEFGLNRHGEESEPNHIRCQLLEDALDLSGRCYMVHCEIALSELEECVPDITA